MNFNFNNDTINKLQEFTSGFLDPISFNKLVLLFEKEASKYFYNRESETNLLRIISSLYDRISFLDDCLKYPHYVDVTIAITAHSNYLTDIIVRNPDFLYLMFDNFFLLQDLTFEKVKTELEDGLSDCKSLDSKFDFLRTYKSKNYLKIGLCDQLGLRNLQDTTEQLSLIAKNINSEALLICISEIEKKYNIVTDKNRYALCALGKLGGDELNYSSDVDFILFFDENSKASSNSDKEYHEILTDAIQLFIQKSTEITEKGFLYRVDFRLRPDGRHSPLCRTIRDYQKYYETKGEDWERQMLIKLSFSGGSKDLYNKFYNYIKSFIYPSAFSVSPIEQVRKMKLKIEKRLNEEQNIKLIPGGIRDIEFSVQALQLLNGGKHPELQTGTSIKAIKALQENDLLKPEEAKIFTAHYIYYRKIEHYLQLMNDKQTHIIPQKGELLQKLSSYFGFENSESFLKNLDEKRNEVRKIYNSIISPEIEEKSVILDFNLFSEKRRAETNLKFLRTGTGLSEQKRFDSRTIKYFEKLESIIISKLKDFANPDATLENFTRIISATKFPSIWYSECLNTNFLDLILRICSYGTKATDKLITDPMLEEMLISRQVYVFDLSEFYSLYSNKYFRFVLSVQFAQQLLSPEHFSRFLTDYIHFQLNSILVKLNIPFNYFVAALGSAGVGEMSFSSDVDLIVVIENTEDLFSAEKIFQEFISTANQKLTGLEIDFRLRPEGKNAPLVADIVQFERYIDQRAQIWEFQAFLKMVKVSGNDVLYQQFISHIQNKLYSLDKEFIKSEVSAMYKSYTKQPNQSFSGKFNIKKSKGGLATIDFLIQYLYLINPQLYKESLGIHTIKRIEKLKIFDSSYQNLEALIENYNFLKFVEISIQNIFNRNKTELPNKTDELNVLSQFIMNSDSTTLMQKINSVKTENLKIYGHYL